MAKDYTVKDAKKNDMWENSYGKFQSYALALDGVGEPVSINRKVMDDGSHKEINTGDTLYGDLVEQSKNGKTWYKFKTQKKQAGGKNDEDYQKGMRWGNALTNATQLVINYGGADLDLHTAVESVVATARLLDGSQDEKAQETAKKVIKQGAKE